MARAKPVERERARAMRSEGWSLPAICAELGVSRASASTWCRDVVVPAGVAARTLRGRVEGRRPSSLQVAKEAELAGMAVEASAHLAERTEREDLVAGLMLYAGEGTKDGRAVSLAGTDPRIVAFHCSWLRRHFAPDESRLRLRVYLHQHLDLGAATRYWCEVTGIPAAQVRAPYRAAPDPTIRRSKHLTGCAYVTIYDAHLARRILAMVDALLPSPPAFRGGAIGSASDC